jgi:superfamily I DNA and/or RNA helicase/predicted DNA-binding WGR domain protein
MEITIKNNFIDFLNEKIEHGGFQNDDAIATVLPLLQEVLTFHEQGKVAPIEGLKHILITNDLLDIDENFIQSPVLNNIRLAEICQPISNTFAIVDETKQTTDIDTASIKVSNATIQLEKDKEVTRPVYLPGYISYESLIKHHDELSDIYILGLVLGSMVTGLNLNHEDDLQTFINHRKSLVYLNSKIHPAIANVVMEMTELDRKKRARDLYEVIEKLKNYRDYNPEKEVDLTTLEGFKSQNVSTRSKWILNKLKSRLFDISRRNRLLYFKPGAKFLNVTVASVPTQINYKNIDPNSLFVWNEDISSKIKSGKQIALSKYLKIEDNPYIPSILDKIRSESIRDVNEYGFSQLRLIICSLNWCNLKDDKYEIINSPLLLIPVEVKKKKGIKDQYTLDITSTEAEVNPVLVYWLRELYDIKLPDSIVLEDLEIRTLYQSIQDQIKLSNSGISINFIDKPRIKLIHTLAKQTLSQFNRKLNRNKNLSHYKNVDYSYQRENFQPLGLSIFKQKIEPSASILEFLINEDVKLSSHNLTDKERSLFVLDDDGNKNPYLWEFDICNMTLGNFNYKKMSLVRDYNEAIDDNINDPIFEKLFSDQPKPIITRKEDFKENIQEKYHIISCDPTQANAIRMASSGESYIIQGPPGTGKSQTITNLISDYIARGKRVLFVCEKRAAIDVVYHRLKQQHLDELCCRIHDSQADKKEFIMNLKDTYAEFIKNDFNLPLIEKQRNEIIATIESELLFLERYNTLLKKEFENVGVSLLTLIERMVKLNEYKSSATYNTQVIPDYKEWVMYGSLIHTFIQQLQENDYEPFVSEHPVRLIKNESLVQEHPVQYIRQLTEQLEDLFEFINNELNKASIPDNLKDNFLLIKELVYDAHRLKPYAENQNTYLFDSTHPSAKQFDDLAFDYKELKKSIDQAYEKNGNWKNKFSEDDLQSAKEQLAAYQNSFLSFLSPGFWKLKSTIKKSYDFSKHSIKPTFQKVLDELQAEYNLINQAKGIENKAAFSFKIKNILETWHAIEDIRKQKDKSTLTFLKAASKDNLVLDLAGLKETTEKAFDHLERLVVNYEKANIIDLLEDIENIKFSLKSLPEMLPLIQQLNKTSAEFQTFIKNEKFSPNEFEKIIGEKNLAEIYALNKEFHRIEAADIRGSISTLKNAYDSLYEINASFIRAKIRKRFNDNIALSTASVTGLSSEEREFKKAYTEGRKIIEHEFNKSMRYRSIRDLASKESGVVIQDLKPIWLMSPLSVSDTLPLNPEHFDVVIFDEASQITLEEGIPPLCRGKQTIIVGDEMQMPPTNFFGSAAPSDDADYNEDENESMQIDADSLLTQGVRKLQDVMLGWHYRSKFESLISFSNAAFYNRTLLTIPDQTTPVENLTEIKATNSAHAVENFESLANRSISFHHMEHGVYEKRTNTAEAEYIAQLVKALIITNKKQSIGVVAFSQEQQYEIENALIRLASADKDFEVQLEEEYQRQEDGQFVGLFVKNLENVQGDERDIIIMSVCYGYDHNKRMIMNFGPINRKGGEKRLNVIFSRAKKHMAIISSIKYTDIKNEYNEGANYFRKFLQYAESVSRGEIKSANQTLDGLSKNTIVDTAANAAHPVVTGISNKLKELGYITDLNVGQSYFRCSIGVRNKDNSNKYCLGILVDTIDHYNNKNLLEQYVLRPSILKSFNWNVIQVYTKDWLHHPEKVLDQIKKAIAGQYEAEEIPKRKTNDVIENTPLIVVAQESIIIENKKEETINEHEIPFQRFSFKDGTSDKFWAIAQDGNRMIVHFGKTGTKGQENIKTFEDPEVTKNEIEKLIQQKIKKGYAAE